MAITYRRGRLCCMRLHHRDDKQMLRLILNPKLLGISRYFEACTAAEGYRVARRRLLTAPVPSSKRADGGYYRRPAERAIAHLSAVS